MGYLDYHPEMEYNEVEQRKLSLEMEMENLTMELGIDADDEDCDEVWQIGNGSKTTLVNLGSLGLRPCKLAVDVKCICVLMNCLLVELFALFLDTPQQ